ncbi:hypothetical protein E4U42_006298 [Claviceps africana]|uniref:Major facilitator superfamily (MFS) profile domain-containing protein n=1 Tax=Claviceps africana TaxID=83212 RepID=A0A8K0NNT3_9HYPO|nr:hypothetical protein E4U42_006298 [Claviceps africana]
MNSEVEKADIVFRDDEHISQTPAPGNQDPKAKVVIPPDGGLTAWTHALLMHLVFFNTWGVANGYGVFQEFYNETLHENPSTIAWIGTVQVFLLFAIGAPAGRLTDAGYFRVVFSCGVALQLLGIFLTSLCSTYWHIFLCQAVCLGIGNGLTFCPALSILPQYFDKYRAFAVGLAASGSATGGIVYVVIFHSTAKSGAVGFPWALRIMGFVMLATYLPCLFLFRPLLPPRPMAQWVDRSAFSDLRFIFFSLSMFFSFWGLYFAFFYLGTFARTAVHIGEPVHLLIVLNAVGIVGRTLPGIIADRWTGMLNLLIPLIFASSLVVFCWIRVNSTSGLYAFSVVYGLLAASLQAIYPAVATTMTPDAARTGTRVGMILTLVSFANLTGPAICGFIITQQNGRFVGAQIFAATSILLAAIMAVCTKIVKQK